MSTLKVGTIQDHANSNTAISIDSSGRVSLPNRLAGAFKQSAQSSAANESSVKIPINTAMYNDGLTLDASNYRVTVPVAGIYMVVGQVGYSGGAESPHSGIWVNGANNALSKGLADAWVQSGDYTNGTQVIVTNHKLLKLDANDYIELYAYHSSGGSMTIHAARTMLSIMKLA